MSGIVLHQYVFCFISLVPAKKTNEVRILSKALCQDIL